MSTRLADRLSAARRNRFVGRAGELQMFETALKATDSPFQILYLYGPGGIGKTSLLREFHARAEQARTPAYYLDGRNLEATPDSFLRALGTVLNLSPKSETLEALGRLNTRHVLLLDTYEA